MKGLTVAVAVGATLAQAPLVRPASAQSALGSSPAAGISFQIPATTPPPPAPSPVTPIRPAPPSPPPDLFRAGPDTYAPRFDRPVPVPLFPYALGGYTAYPERVIERTVVLVPASALDVASASAAGAAAADKPVETATYKPAVPGHKRPLYVIPNCYLGDSPPDPGRLPNGCLTAQTRQLRQR